MRLRGDPLHIATPNIERTCPETEIIQELLDLDGKHLIELGCGRAEITRALALGGPGRAVLATEVDAIQHARNLQIDDLPNVTFRLAGAQAIPSGDASADVVFLFKSLHHVPTEQMDQALREIARVLKPGGFAYISEPVFAGDFNAILRLFHDEEQVRLAAFKAVRRAVDGGVLQLQQELFFQAPMYFMDFADFEDKVMRVTHTAHRISEALHETVRQRFLQHMQADGARFRMPIRVDLLRKG